MGWVKKMLRNCFLIFFFFNSANVTQPTPEIFTDDPSKLSFVYFFAFLLGIEGLRMAVQTKMKAREDVGGHSTAFVQCLVVYPRCHRCYKHAPSFFLHFLL